jgi:hypothetical protein
MTDTHRPQPVSFVPTAFFAEFLAGAHEGFKTEPRHDALHRMAVIETERTTRPETARAA